TEPRTEAGANERVAPGMQFQQRPPMSRIGTVDRTNHAQIIRDSPNLGKQIAHPRTALAILLEREGRLQQIARLRREARSLGKGERFAVVALQQRLVVERVNL